MKIKRFNQLNESDDHIQYTIEDSHKLMTNLLDEWETEINKSSNLFLKGRLLGAIETLLTLNGKLEGGKPYDHKTENFESMMLRMGNEFIKE